MRRQSWSFKLALSLCLWITLSARPNYAQDIDDVSAPPDVSNQYTTLFNLFHDRDKIPPDALLFSLIFFILPMLAGIAALPSSIPEAIEATTEGWNAWRSKPQSHHWTKVFNEFKARDSKLIEAIFDNLLSYLKSHHDFSSWVSNLRSLKSSIPISDEPDLDQAIERWNRHDEIAPIREWIEAHRKQLPSVHSEFQRQMKLERVAAQQFQDSLGPVIRHLNEYRERLDQSRFFPFDDLPRHRIGKLKYNHENLPILAVPSRIMSECSLTYAALNTKVQATKTNRSVWAQLRRVGQVSNPALTLIAAGPLSYIFAETFIRYLRTQKSALPTESAAELQRQAKLKSVRTLEAEALPTNEIMKRWPELVPFTDALVSTLQTPHHQTMIFEITSWYTSKDTVIAKNNMMETKQSLEHEIRRAVPKLALDLRMNFDQYVAFLSRAPKVEASRNAYRSHVSRLFETTLTQIFPELDSVNPKRRAELMRILTDDFLQRSNDIHIQEPKSFPLHSEIPELPKAAGISPASIDAPNSSANVLKDPESTLLSRSP